MMSSRVSDHAIVDVVCETEAGDGVVIIYVLDSNGRVCTVNQKGVIIIFILLALKFKVLIEFFHKRNCHC